MKKKVLICMFSFLMLLTLTACGSNKGDSKKGSIDGLIVNGFDLRLTENSTLDDMTYKYSKGSKIDKFGKNRLITYLSGDGPDQLLFKILIQKIESTTIEESMKEMELTKIDTMTYNNITWEVYEDFAHNKTYACDFYGDVYSIGFVFYSDTGTLEKEFMRSITFHQ